LVFTTEDTCAKGPSLEESDEARQKWRKEIHGNREAVQKMQALARQSTVVFHSVNENAAKVTNIAKEGVRVAEEVAKNALKALEQNRNGPKQ
jgi:predicted  nucleic acid-binding Zn-ribbon protein